jgi:Domain of unknown function (DUF4270)
MISTTRFWNNDSVLLMMKNFLLSMCGLFLMAALFSCNDDNTIGSSVQPDKDKISVFYQTVNLTTQTVFVDSVQLRNSIAMLGEFTDPTFGTTKSDFMAQLYCGRDFSFPNDVKQIDSAYIYFYYDKWFGDSSTVHHVNVYELTKPLDILNNYYSNIDPSSYFNKSNLLTHSTFTTGDLYTSDTLKSLSSYSAAIRIPIDTTFANRFLRDSRLHPEYFATPEKFREYFKGIYVTTDYGNGSILYINHAEIEMCYDTRLYSNVIAGARDSFVIGASYFPVNKEVKQINRCEHKDISSYLRPSANDSLNYIFAPAGMFTKVTLPDTLFTKKNGLLSGKTISQLRLKMLATQIDTKWAYAMAPPAAMLLIRASDAQKFFREYKLNDGVYSFLAKYSSTDKDYTFDLSYYAQKMVRESDNPGSTTFQPYTDMLLIPVDIVTNNDGDQVRLDHVITPAAVKIRSAKHPSQPMRLEVIYSRKN